MEATGLYWRPVWHILEGRFELVLANAQHIRNVPGRKTDVSDAAWIADLLAHGLIRSSFVPPAKIQELRDITRTRKQLVREIGQHTLQIQKTLEDANIKVASVLSNVISTSGRAMLAAIIAGEEDPARNDPAPRRRRSWPRSRHEFSVSSAPPAHWAPFQRSLLQRSQPQWKARRRRAGIPWRTDFGCLRAARSGRSCRVPPGLALVA